ncbi:ABC transporter permease [Candidatus Bathyarchaeota archaeon A05DMB-2]|jgi:ABC-type dipeptide/oligopeptide/nickel transport system permease subunit|nr:ABC transporter permease [Candidatus Bathyarchaeota archaeon A05DMB-2]
MKKEKSTKLELQYQNEKSRPKGVSQWNIAWRRFKKNKAALVGALIIGFVMFLAAFDSLIAPYPPNATPGFYVGEARVPPSLKYLFGTDKLGHDVFSQVVYGARSALYVGFGAAAIAMSLAVLVGLVSGYYGGLVDNVLMRITEIFLVIPFLLILLVFLKVITAVAPASIGGLSIVTLMIGVFSWASNARIIRGEVLRVKESEFIEASKALGASKRRIIFRHIFPNVLHIIIVLTTLMIATAILVEAAVSFLGFGDPAAITWGHQLQLANEAVKEAWWEGVFPGLFITLLVLGFNLLGNGLRDALDPRLRE